MLRCENNFSVRSRLDVLLFFPFFDKASVSLPDQLHSVPIAQMGNYQDFLKAAPQPLRDADPEQPKRLHTFGNPFKLDKKASLFFTLLVFLLVTMTNVN